ncbi:hypothetical protein EZMO1_1931 [Endozoicomonas montiporae CL-33]|uniref:Uncharacterized protein n=1 Tax=Endozoicomonas montiporae CL-33 TaxID=570277 RepID=A0A142BBD7_9GAMM|nr:hypothetical protein EZMO1_1931 [Endozoicomonas montiporae CL-33]
MNLSGSLPGFGFSLVLWPGNEVSGAHSTPFWAAWEYGEVAIVKMMYFWFI